MQRPWNRCCRKRKHIYILFQLLDNLFVLDAKPLLFINYKKSQIFEFYIFGKQSVGADYNIYASFCKSFNGCFLLCFTAKTGEHFYFKRKFFKALF